MTRVAARAVCAAKITGPYLLMFMIALLSAGTISNQIRIGQANDRLQQQAENGQKSLTRACKLVPGGLRIQADALKRGVITAKQFDAYVDATRTACPQVRLPASED